MKVVGSKATVPATASNLAQRIDSAVEVALAETLSKSKLEKPEDVIRKIGQGSYEHTNFRMFLAPHVVKILEGMEGVEPVNQAWVHSIDVTESDPSAADSAGDGSPCDWATGIRLPIIMKVDEKNEKQTIASETVNDTLVQVLRGKGAEVVDDYLDAEFVTQDDIASGRGAGARIRSPYYPPTELSWEKSSL